MYFLNFFSEGAKFLNIGLYSLRVTAPVHSYSLYRQKWPIYLQICLNIHEFSLMCIRKHEVFPLSVCAGLDALLVIVMSNTYFGNEFMQLNARTFDRIDNPIFTYINAIFSTRIWFCFQKQRQQIDHFAEICHLLHIWRQVKH